MASTVYKYRVRCTTDSKDEYVWSETEPTTCPTDTAHTIDSGKTAIVETKADNEVVIQEEKTKTGAHYQTKSIGGDVTASIGWNTLEDFSFPYPISIFSGEAYCRAETDKDQIEVLISPSTVVGAITSDVSAGDTTFDVAQSVIDNVYVGYFIELSGDGYLDDCGRITAIDKVAKTITVETAAANSFTAAAPTYVKMTIKMVDALELTSNHRMCIGESKIGGTYIPTNTTMRLRYNNVDGAAKRFVVMIEYLY